MDVGAWLRSLGLERYEAAFRENGIDLSVLPDLTDQQGNLSSAVRLFVLDHYRARTSGLEHPPLRRAEIERAPNGVGH